MTISGRFACLRPFYSAENLSVQKLVHIKDNSQLSVRMDYFNAFNRYQLGYPNYQYKQLQLRGDHKQNRWRKSTGTDFRDPALLERGVSI
jgi:hypothetical protein